MINSGLFDRMSQAGDVNLHVKQSSEFYVFINADILNGCEFKCSGCFVNKGTNSFDLNKDLSLLSDLSSQINQSPYHMEEVALGPTDFFSAKNTEDVILHPDFKSIFTNKDTKLVIISTLQTSAELIKEKLNLLEKELPHLDIDLLIPIDVDRMLSDESLIIDLKKKWKIIEESSLIFDPSFQVNLCATDFLDKDPGNLIELADLIKEEFDTILEFNPSVLSSRKNKANILSYWNNLIKHNSGSSSLVYTMLNKNHTGLNNFVMNFRRGNLYVCPFIYENVFMYDEGFLIEKKTSGYDLDHILKGKEDYFVKQMNYAEKTDQCLDCEYLVPCAHKNVLTFMEHNKTTECFLNKMEAC